MTEEDLDSMFRSASIKAWEEYTGKKHYSNMKWVEKIIYRLKRALLAFRNII